MSTESVSMVVSTLGRTTELVYFLKSVVKQTVLPMEVIIVDQNEDERLVSILQPFKDVLTLTHLRCAEEKGLSRGRNAGLKLCASEYVLFPDDDCWYPDWFIERAVNLLRIHDVDVICGRAADEKGNSINGRFEKNSQNVTRANVWTTQIEWVVIFRRCALEEVAGYDENVGVGAMTPWQSCEGQDINLRLLKKRKKIFYDPSLYGHHKNILTENPDKALIRKGRQYGRGMGRVLRIHGYHPLILINWVLRPLLRGCQSVVMFRWRKSIYCLNVSFGRFRGYLDYPQ